jgi:Protein of unknown function (DUF3568)
MKAKFLLGLAGLAIVAIGCVSTVSGRKTAAVPFVNDRTEGRYERPASQVYNAAKDVLVRNGTLLRESTLFQGEKAGSVLTLEGKVNQRSVWISVQQLDPKTSSVIVQARTKGGGTDMELCHELDKEIALKLVE